MSYRVIYSKQLMHYGVKGMKWGENLFQTEYEGTGKRTTGVQTSEQLAKSKATETGRLFQTRDEAVVKAENAFVKAANSNNVKSATEAIQNIIKAYQPEIKKLGYSQESMQSLYNDVNEKLKSSQNTFIWKGNIFDPGGVDLYYKNGTPKSSSFSQAKVSEENAETGTEVQGVKRVENRPLSRETNVTGDAKEDWNKTGASAEKSTNEALEKIAKQVIYGNWGVGSDRKKMLTEAGYDYEKVQSLVNKMLSGK